MTEDALPTPTWHAELQALILAETNDPRLVDRIMEEIEFNRIYYSGFNHGTDGHILRITIALMAMLLNKQRE